MSRIYETAHYGADNGNYRHGGYGTRLYGIWQAMKKRCYAPNNKNYSLYGGRGIEVCDEWYGDFGAFQKWALRNGYADSLSIDRIDNSGNYEPSNCRWADATMQGANRRTSILISYNGETHCIAEWARLKRIKKRTLYDRIETYGWTIERALNEPVSLDKYHRLTREAAKAALEAQK